MKPRYITTRREWACEILACLAMLAFLFGLLVFGSAAMPYTPSPANEEVLAGSQ